MARHAKYKTSEEMQTVIDQYFTSCEGKPLTDTDGNPVFDKYGTSIFYGARPPTITGLALALGFASRQALVNYRGRSEKFNDTITRARARVEEYAESRLYDRDGAKGAEFTLRCNFGWRLNEGEASAGGMTSEIIEAVKKV